MIQQGNTFMLSIFFLYLVLMSSNLNKLLACELQRTLQNNIYIQHFLIFLSIFMFTFILKWFVPESIYVSHIDKVTNNYIEYENEYIVSSLFYSLLIYFIFVLTTKQTGIHIVIFLILLFSLIFLYLYYALLIQKNNSYIGEFKKLFISSDDIGDKSESLIYVHNTLNLGYIIFIINLLVGSYSYYIKQSKEYKNWSWVTFIFGNNKCRNVM